MRPLVVSYHFCYRKVALLAELPVRVRIGAPDR
jgi:hypothetical protein